MRQPSNLRLISHQLLLRCKILHLSQPRPLICTEARVLGTMTLAPHLSPQLDRTGERAGSAGILGSQLGEVVLVVAPLLDSWKPFGSTLQEEGAAGSQKRNLSLCSPLGATPPAGHLS